MNYEDILATASLPTPAAEIGQATASDVELFFTAKARWMATLV